MGVIATVEEENAYQFSTETSFCLVDKAAQPKRFRKTICLLFNQKQAIEIRDYLDREIKKTEKASRLRNKDNYAVGMMVHTGTAIQNP